MNIPIVRAMSTKQELVTRRLPGGKDEVLMLHTITIIQSEENGPGEFEFTTRLDDCRLPLGQRLQFELVLNEEP